MFARHAITRLPVPVREQVQEAIYRVLREYADGGNHGIDPYRGPIPIQHLYLLAANLLVANPTALVRPNRIDRFTSLTHGQETAPSVSFPNYGIPEQIASLMRLTLWEAFLHGILAPAPISRPILDNDNNDTGHRTGGGQFLDLDYVMLTPYGVDLLLQQNPTQRIRAYDPGGYMANFGEPGTDQEMLRYVDEGIQVLQGNHLLASVVLIGIANERLVEVTAEAVGAAQGTAGTDWYNNIYGRKHMISEKFKALKDRLQGTLGPELRAADLSDPLETVATLAFETIRVARNDIAHPSGARFTWNQASGLYHHFVGLYKLLHQARRVAEAAARAAP